MIASTTRSSCSLGLRLAIYLNQCGPQALQPTKLKLFDSSFGASEILCDLANTLLFRKPHYNNSALKRGKLVHQLKKPRAVFNLFKVDGLSGRGRVLNSGTILPRGPFPSIDYHVCRN